MPLLDCGSGSFGGYFLPEKRLPLDLPHKKCKITPMTQKTAVKSHKTKSLKPQSAVLSTGNRQLYTLPGQSYQLPNSLICPPIYGWNFPTVHPSFFFTGKNMRDNYEH
jgi:hypothetical protein